MREWSKYREDDGGYIHTLPIDGSEAFMKVEKTRGGDYSITAMMPDDPCGGDVVYAPTLPKAKLMAENIVASGEYEDFLLDA